MSAATVQLQQSAIQQYTRQLRLPTVGGQFLKLAEEAVKQKQGHVAYLEALLGVEVEERERNAVARRIQEAKFPKVKTLEDFRFEEAPHLPAAEIRKLAEGGYSRRWIARARLSSWWGTTISCRRWARVTSCETSCAPWRSRPRCSRGSSVRPVF